MFPYSLFFLSFWFTKPEYEKLQGQITTGPIGIAAVEITYLLVVVSKYFGQLMVSVPAAL